MHLGLFSPSSIWGSSNGRRAGAGDSRRRDRTTKDNKKTKNSDGGQGKGGNGGQQGKGGSHRRSSRVVVEDSD